MRVKLAARLEEWNLEAFTSQKFSDDVKIGINDVTNAGDNTYLDKTLNAISITSFDSMWWREMSSS